MDKICAVTGSFDPVTLGHVSVVKKALKNYNKVYVLMLINPEKEYFFTAKQRLNMLKKTFSDFDRVEVAFYDGYTADFCKEHDITVLIRGVRNRIDEEYEKKLAKANYEYGKLNTVFYTADDDIKFISSNLVREKIKNNQPLDGLLPNDVIIMIKEIIKYG